MGGLVVYDISNNQLTGDAFIGTIGLEWQYAGIASIHAVGASDLVLRNVNSGAFEVYDIAGNTLVGAASLGAVGLDWQIGSSDRLCWRLKSDESARASDGRFWRRQRPSREREYGRHRFRHVTAAAANDAAARLSSHR
jgi:hypothetical protein